MGALMWVLGEIFQMTGLWGLLLLLLGMVPLFLVEAFKRIKQR